MREGSDQFLVASGGELRRRFGLTAENRPTIKLDPDEVPHELRHLIPLAEYWGVADDLIRDDLVQKADSKAKEALVAAVAGHEDALEAWLAGSDAKSHRPTQAYVAFTAMWMAADEAEGHSRESK